MISKLDTLGLQPIQHIFPEENLLVLNISTTDDKIFYLRDSEKGKIQSLGISNKNLHVDLGQYHHSWVDVVLKLSKQGPNRPVESGVIFYYDFNS